MPAELKLALDLASVRSRDADGRLHISTAHISKANVCPYLGSEIPGAEALGLEPGKTYMLLRDPEELRKAAPTLNNIQLLVKHDPVSIKDPKKELTVGSTGTDAKWNPPYLDNSLVVWDEQAISDVESGKQKELSAGYYYTADMTPGKYEGVAYDGVMRDMSFNHVALVVEGRAGGDVVVGDSMENLNMPKTKQATTRKAALAQGAIAVVLAPRLAQDAKLDIAAALKGTTHANWAAAKISFMNFLGKQPVTSFKSKQAMDEAVKEAADALKALDNVDPDSDFDGVENKTKPAADSPRAALEALLKGKVSDEDMERAIQLAEGGAADDDLETDIKLDKELLPLLQQLLAKLKTGGATDADIEAAAAKKAAQDTETEAAKKVAEPGVNKAAMDAAIKQAQEQATEAAVKRVQDLEEAKKLVKPLIGSIMGQDSAQSVYRLALDSKKVDISNVHPSAFRSMVMLLLAQPQSTDQGPGKKLALDAAGKKDFKARFPTAGAIKQL